jgi:hypothetical protein
MAFSFVHIPLTREQGVARAKSQVGKGLYKLGGGTRDCKSETPFDENNGCDCSNYVDWSCGFNKYQKLAVGEIWYNTDAIIEDAKHGGPNRLFEVVPSNETVLPGDILVYGSVYVHGERTPGHVVIITDGSITPAQRHGFKSVYKGITYMTFDPRLVKISNCAPRHGVWPGAVRTQSVASFPKLRTDGYIVRYKHWVEAQAVAQAAVVAVPPAPQTAPITVEEPPPEPMIAKLAKLFPVQPKKRNPNFWPTDIWFPGYAPQSHVYA